MRVSWAECLTVLVAITAACGGRSIHGEGDEEAGGGSAGARSSQAGASTGAAGAKGGSTGTGGSTTKGGSVGIAGTGSSCTGVACPAVDCGPGTRAELPPGQCCAVCVADGCAQQQAAYQDFRKVLVEKYSSQGCMSANDCSYFRTMNACEYGSCALVLPSTMVENLDSNLRSFAAQTCGPSCSFDVGPCPALPPIQCVASRCQ